MDVDKLTPHDLDQLSRLIVDALQEVEKDRGRAGPGPRDVEGQLTDEEEEGADRDNEEEERWQGNPPPLKPRENLPDAPAELQGHFGCILVYAPLGGRVPRQPAGEEDSGFDPDFFLCPNRRTGRSPGPGCEGERPDCVKRHNHKTSPADQTLLNTRKSSSTTTHNFRFIQGHPSCKVY